MDYEELVVARLVRYVMCMWMWLIDMIYILDDVNWYMWRICDEWLWVDCHVCESDDWVDVDICVWSLSS